VNGSPARERAARERHRRQEVERVRIEHDQPVAPANAGAVARSQGFRGIGVAGTPFGARGGRGEREHKQGREG
jgi:hypothetical protein